MGKLMENMIIAKIHCCLTKYIVQPESSQPVEVNLSFHYYNSLITVISLPLPWILQLFPVVHLKKGFHEQLLLLFL